MNYPFTEEEFQKANQEWFCNCGPAALAFALQLPLDAVRDVIPNFSERRYTNPTMMKAALANLRREYVIVPNPSCGRDYQKFGILMWGGPVVLVRIQWTGPWTANGKPMKWAARQTHWIVCWRDGKEQMTFDVNSGIVRRATWEVNVVRQIVATVDRADGGWYPANVWRLEATP